MTDAQIRKLRRLARGATPGPWEPAECGGWSVMAGPLVENRRGYLLGGRGTICEMDDMDAAPSKQRANARFIAAVGPDVVNALLDEIEALKARLPAPEPRG